jgi:hypothetical protein
VHQAFWVDVTAKKYDSNSNFRPSFVPIVIAKTAGGVMARLSLLGQDFLWNSSDLFRAQRKFESHPGIRWGFCQDCGTSLLYDCDQALEKIYVTVASLDGPLDREPDSHVSFEEQPAWARAHSMLPKYFGKSENLIK